jgi:hypothetical protein
MAEENATDAQQGDQAQQQDLTWDALRAAWEEGGLTPGQIQGRLEASRKWEGRAKAAPSPEELAELRAKAERQDALEQELASEADKKANEARKAAKDEADATYRPMLAETAFRIAIGDRKTEDEVSDFIADLNLERFLTDDGKVDTAKVLARVEQFAPATAQQSQTRPGPTAAGQGNRSGNARTQPGMGTVSAGRDLYAEMHPKKAS